MPLRTTTRWWGVVLDAPDAPSLAHFYARLLGWSVFSEEATFSTVAPSEHAGHYLAVQHEPLYVRPVWPARPGEPQMSMHLDLAVDDLVAAVAHAVDVGAVEAGHQPQDDVRVMLDPVGHPFCLYLDPDATPPHPLVAQLGLVGHPEGGWYRPGAGATTAGEDRGAWSSIQYLLHGGEVSTWHRVDADELWVAQAGGPVELTVEMDGAARTQRLGTDVAAGEEPTVLVPAHAWQTARGVGAVSLVTCVVVPAFRFDGLELRGTA